MDEKDSLIAEVVAARGAMVRVFAYERSTSILKSTLTMQQLKLITLLAIHGPLGGHVLAGHLGVSMPTVTGVVDRLVTLGLVERRENPQDRRVRLVSLSDEGQAVVSEHEKAEWEMTRDVLGKLDLAELRGLATGLTALTAAVERRLREPGPQAPPPG